MAMSSWGQKFGLILIFDLTFPAVRIARWMARAYGYMARKKKNYLSQDLSVTFALAVHKLPTQQLYIVRYSSSHMAFEAKQLQARALFWWKTAWKLLAWVRISMLLRCEWVNNVEASLPPPPPDWWLCVMLSQIEHLQMVQSIPVWALERSKYWLIPWF